jgi:sugar phosphate isomerase/epimerase
MSLCWGTVPQAGLIELMEAAALSGFSSVMVTPEMYRLAALRREAAELRSLIKTSSAPVVVLDPLISALPEVPSPELVEPSKRPLFAFGEDDCFRIAEALGAETINLVHFLGPPIAHDRMLDAVGGVTDRAAARGLKIVIEFLPGTGIPDLRTAARIVDEIGRANLGIMFDTWHFARTGLPWDDLKSLPGGMIRAVQVSDRIEPPRETPYRPGADRLLPGDGELPLAEMLAAVLARSPDASIGLEVFSDDLATLSASRAASLAASALGRVLDAVRAAGGTA